MTPTLTHRAFKALEAARAALAAGMLDRAHNAIADAVRLDPDSYEVRLTAARIYLELGKPDKAMNAIDALLVSNPSATCRPDAMLLRAEVLMRNGLHDHAESLLADFVEHYPHDVRPRRLLAGLCIERDRMDLAMAHLRVIMMFEPSDSNVRRTLAGLLEQTNPQEAVALLLSDRHDQADPAIRLRAAIILSTIGRDADAEALYRDLITEFPSDAAMLIDAGELALRQGAITLAAERLTAATGLPGRHQPRAFAALGRAHMRAGRPLAAGRFWWKAAKRSTDRDDAVAALAHLQVCALSVGRNTLVERIRQRLSPITSTHERRLMLARAWQDTNLHDTADQHDQAVSPLITITQRAAATLARHAALHPEYADAWYHDAVCKTMLGEYDEARGSVRNALQLNPHYQAAATLAANLGRTPGVEREAA